MTGECSRKIIRNDSISLQVFCEKMVLAQNIYFFVFYLRLVRKCRSRPARTKSGVPLFLGSPLETAPSKES